MRKGILIEAPPTSLDRFVPKIREGHAGEYDAKNSGDKPKDHKHACADTEPGECFGSEEAAVEEKDTEFGESNGADKEKLVGPSGLAKMSVCGY